MQSSDPDDTNDAGTPASKAPPEWFARAAWKLHRAVYRITRGRVGLWRPPPGRWGAMRLKTIGRRTGRERVAILAYFEDGPNLVTMAMNGWLNPEPKWWLNLQAIPEATVELRNGRRRERNGLVSGRGGATWAATWAISTTTPRCDQRKPRS